MCPTLIADDIVAIRVVWECTDFLRYLITFEWQVFSGLLVPTNLAILLARLSQSWDAV